jgi:hypothetical protein
MEEIQNSEVEEVAPQEEANVVQESPAQEVQREESRQERNWREMRQQKAELERELRSARELNQKILEAQLANAQVRQQEPDEIDQLDDNEYVPKATVKKIVEREANKIIKAAVSEVEKAQKAREDSQFMDRLKRQYSDFEDIVNVDTMRLLEEQDPELASTIVELKDPYKIGVQTYKYIKAMNLSEKVPSSRRVKEVEKKLEQNNKTVQTPQAYDKRPLAAAYKMTEDQKAELYKEMMGYASQAGFGY